MSAAEAAFGDLDDLERDAKQYMRKSPTYIRGREPIEYDGRLEIVKLDEIASEFESLRLENRRSYKRKQTLDKLQKLAERRPEKVEIWNEIADAQHMLAHRDAWRDARKAADSSVEDEQVKPGPSDMRWALASIDKALAIDPDNVRSNALKAEFLMDVARDSDQDHLWDQARSHAIAANRANPDNPFPLSLYWKSYAEANVAVPDTARAALVRAFELAPESSELRVDYALDLAMRGEVETARKVVEFLVASPHSERRGKLALKQIDAIASGSSYSDAVDLAYEKDEEDDEA